MVQVGKKMLLPQIEKWAKGNLLLGGHYDTV